jgi:hypothetical protein
VSTRPRLVRGWVVIDDNVYVHEGRELSVDGSADGRHQLDAVARTTLSPPAGQAIWT